jgi:hypothetical protein
MKKNKNSAGAAPRVAETKKSVVAAKPAQAPAAPKPVVAVKPPKKAGPQPTVIEANIDVGFGNTLYIRGEGPGLNWDRGQPMECVKDDLWAFTIEAAAKSIVFKFLINDETWCTGDDYVVEPGNKITLVPTF